MPSAVRSAVIVVALLGGAGGPAEAFESYIAAGLGGSDTAAHAWQSATVTPFGGLDASGPVMRALLTQLMFRYETSLPDDPSAVIEVHGVAGDAEAGWQWVAGANRLALLAGAAARQYDLSPDDPGSDLEGFHWSASVSALATVAVPQAPGWAVSGEATYRPQVNELWAQIRPGFDLGDGFRVGPEAAVNRGDDYLFARFGVAANGYRFTFTSTDVFVGGAAGVSLDEGFSPSPYGGIWLGVKF
jgi:hypothetical protein